MGVAFVLGPIRHASLSPELLARIKAVFDEVGPCVGDTLEQWEINFMRDSHPEREVVIWERISGALKIFRRELLSNKRPPVDQERKLIGALVSISSGPVPVSGLGVNKVVAKNLINCYKRACGMVI